MTDDLCSIDSWGLPAQIVEVNILYLKECYMYILMPNFQIENWAN